ncbi:MAG: FG-GAP repeat domain-containing protein, partial [Planctomycetota bacterium]
MRVTWALISTLCSIGCAGTGPTVHSDGTIPAACAGCVSPPPLEALAADASPKVRRLRTFHDQREDKRHPYLGMAATLEGIRDLIPKASSAVERLRLEHLLTHALLCEGSAEEGVGVLERWRLALPDLAVSPDTEMRFWYGLGMAHFRLAERQNCVAGHNEDSCLFPLEGGGVHTQGEEALAAVRAFELALELDPRFDEARWLANVAQMALGAYPDQTPDRYRLPPTHVESETDLPRFKDRAAALGVARHDRAGGAVLEDIDGNGLLDVLTSSFDPGHRLALYFQRAPEVFEDGSTSPGLEDQLGGVDLLCRDFDDDGLLDILVLRGGHLGEIGQLPDSLLQQVQPGVFRDVTAEAGFEIDAPTRTASAADIDLDGDLDLFLGYETILRGPSGARFPHRLLRNDGGMRFTDITDGSGIATAPTCAGASFGDIDGDRYPDLFVSHSSARNRLYHNRGDGTFTDVTADAGVAEPLESSVTWFFDYDNDGDLDLFVAHYAQSDRGAAIARYYFESVVPRSTMRLYDNRGNGRFDDVTAARGLARVCFPIGGNFGDLDGNGFPDIYLATGAP